MTVFLHCDEGCVAKLSSVFRSLTSDGITADHLSAKDKVISAMAHELAAKRKMNLERVKEIYDLVFGHSNQLIYSLSIIMILGVLIALNSSGFPKRHVESIAVMLNAPLLGKIMMHYKATMRICEEVGSAISSDGLSGYALVGYLYSPILLTVELLAIYILTYIVYERTFRKLGRNEIAIRLSVFFLFFTCIVMVYVHALVAIGEVEPGSIPKVMDMNLNIYILTASIVLASDFFCLLYDQLLSVNRIIREIRDILANYYR